MAARKERSVEVEALGVKATAYPERLDDYDLYEIAARDGAESPSYLIASMNAIFGEVGWKAITDGLRDADGKLTMTRVNEFCEKIAGEINELKN